MLLTGFRSFQRGTVNLFRSKGCKAVVSRSLRMIPSSGNRIQAARMWCSVGWATDFFYDSQLWRLAALQSLDLLRSTVPLWKDLKPVVNILLAQRGGNILKIGFALSNWPYLDSSCLLGGWFVLFSIVLWLETRALSLTVKLLFSKFKRFFNLVDQRNFSCNLLLWLGQKFVTISKFCCWSSWKITWTELISPLLVTL